MTARIIRQSMRNTYPPVPSRNPSTYAATLSLPVTANLTYIRQLATWLLVSISIAFSTSMFAASELPNIPSNSTTRTTAKEEQAIGKMVAASLNRSPMSLELSPHLWLEDLMTPLANHSDLDRNNLQLFLINDSSINAFAAPGGIIGLHSGLLVNAKHVEEVIAVLSHEIAHLSLRHYARRKETNARNQPAYIAAILASVIAATQVDTDVGIAGIHATISTMFDQQMAFSRQHEREADRVGYELMLASDFDGSKMLAMLKQLESPWIEHDPKWAWARSHPISSQRIADLTLRVNQQDTPSPKNVPAYQFSFDLLKIRLRVENADLTNISPQQLLKRATIDTNKDAAQDNKDYQRFAKAMISIKKREWETAATHLQVLAKTYPTEIFIWDAWMKSLLATGNAEDVLVRSRRNLRAEINTSLARNYLAQGYAKNNQRDKAIATMYRLMDDRPQWIGGWKQISEWAGQTNAMTDYHIATGFWHIMRGNISQAKLQQEIVSNHSALSKQQSKWFEQLKTQLHLQEK